MERIEKKRKPMIEVDSKDINICLTDRELKGFRFETRVDNILRQSNIIYNGNPLSNVYEWKRHQGKGSDFKIVQWNWEIEAKYSEAKIFPSWINRDWLPRFDSNSHSLKVIVHNKEMKLPINSMELCFLHDVYLVEIDYLNYAIRMERKKREGGNKLIEANRTNKRKSNKKNKLLEVKNKKRGVKNRSIEPNKASKESHNLEGKRREEGNKVIEPSKANNNTNNNVNNSNISNSKVENGSDDNISECIGSIDERKRIKGYVTFTLDEIKEYFRIKNEYIASNTEEPKLHHVLYGKILRYAIYNWTNLCKFCRDYPCFYIEYHNGVKNGNFYLLGDAEESKTYMNIIDKIHKCLRKRLYLFFFKNYTYFNTSIQEDRTINENKNPQTTITDYMEGKV